jgi:GPI inositol-deacylase
MSLERSKWRNPWSMSWLSLSCFLGAVLLLLGMFQSFTVYQQDPKGGSMSYMSSAFVKFPDFDTEHTRFATKYSLYLYREVGVDEDSRVKGVPVLFISGNAGSYKQVRSLASEAEYFRHYTNDHYINNGSEKLGLDFFTVDFNEELTAFHGQTLLDQAEYLNDAIAYILSLYHNPERSRRISSLPDPSSVILVGHSMGGMVARTMLTVSNYQTNSVNTIITLSAAHARPPVTFDAEIVNTYKTVNDYWRKAHSKEWGMDNPLWHVTVISIAGGGLDTVVPSDYASVASLIPDTHGFTVFTSSIPSVWTGMDHLAITWCDEFRKTAIQALFEVLDVNRPGQTKPRGDRMRIFKKWFLTGLEDIAEKTLPSVEPSALLTLEDASNTVLSQGERLVINSLGSNGQRKAFFLPVPPQETNNRKRFTLLSSVDNANSDLLELMFCSVFPLQGGHASSLFGLSMDFSGDNLPTGSTRLVCKSAHNDLVRLPASTKHSKYPFDKTRPFSFVQYDLDMLAEYQFVVVVDKGNFYSNDFIIAEFSAISDSEIVTNVNTRQLLDLSLQWKLPAKRPLVMEIKVPALESSLLAYHLSVSPNTCADSENHFRPLVRQHVSDVYESKFFVNVDEADINIHGVAPYMPPAIRQQGAHGLSLQIWSDPTCEVPIHVVLSLDVVGSFGKLWMRYRTLLATMPLFIVALVLAKQFKTYDESGIFMSFAAGLNQTLFWEIPAFLACLVLAAMWLSTPHMPELNQQHWFKQSGNGSESMSDYTMNNLLIGAPDAFFWFLLPIFGVISIGLCITINYLVLILTNILALPFSCIKLLLPKLEDPRRMTSFAVFSTRQRFLVTSLLLILVATVLPYQFAYFTLCLFQLFQSVRALLLQRESKRSDPRTIEQISNFYNYIHSLLVLMLWILPINVPVLVVWIRNLAVQWLTPFTTHHNILSILPFILLLETGATGKMVPRVTSRLRHVTTAILVIFALCATFYGVSYAYALHQAANTFCAWLVIILWMSGSWELNAFAKRWTGIAVDKAGIRQEVRNKKRP